ncbi:MAG: hypothetical protein ABI680_10410 [Chthoniobacteraceae bacterium]
MIPRLITPFLPLVFASCANQNPPFPSPTAVWKTDSGQLQYATSKRSIIGEFTATHLGGDLRFEFSKGGTLPLLKLVRTGNTIRAEGVLARGRWQGPADSAPSYLGGWVRVSNALIDSPAQPGQTLVFDGPQPGERFKIQFNR